MLCQSILGTFAVHLEVIQHHLIVLHNTINGLFAIAIKDPS